MKKNNLDYIRKLIIEAENNLIQAKKLVQQITSDKINYQKEAIKINSNSKPQEKLMEKQVFGVFDGENMVDSDGKKYSVPANYASKSKLVSGDKLKLMILNDGTFIYKQIEPVKRKKIIGVLKIKKNRFLVENNKKSYKVLPASITYFKAQPDDKLTILIPATGKAVWAAVENILPKSN